MADFLSVRQAAEQLHLDQSTVYRLCGARKIQHRRMGTGKGRIVFTTADLDQYLESCVVPVGVPEPVESHTARLKHVRPQNFRRA